MNKEEYFTEDSLIKNEVYNSIKPLVTCPKCHNLFKNPLICSKCSTSFCENCIENKSKCDNCPNEDIEYKESKIKNQLLSTLKYKCNNCLEEVIQSDIKAHLESNCEKIERTKTLGEIFTTKKELIRIPPEIIEKKMKNNEPIYTLKSN